MDDFQRQRFILVYRNYLQGKAIIRDRNYTSIIQRALHQLYLEADLTIARRMEFDALRANVESSYYFDMGDLSDDQVPPIEFWVSVHEFVKNEYMGIKGIKHPEPVRRLPQNNLCMEIY